MWRRWANQLPSCNTQFHEVYFISYGKGGLSYPVCPFAMLKRHGPFGKSQQPYGAQKPYGFHAVSCFLCEHRSRRVGPFATLAHQLCWTTHCILDVTYIGCCRRQSKAWFTLHYATCGINCSHCRITNFTFTSGAAFLVFPWSTRTLPTGRCNCRSYWIGGVVLCDACRSTRLLCRRFCGTPFTLYSVL